MSALDHEPVSQPLQALKLANAKRSAVHDLKAELRALPRQDAANHLADVMARRSPHRLDHAVVYSLLMAVPFIGHTKAAKILRDAGLYGPDRRIRECTPRQRDLIAGCLRNYWSDDA